MDKKPLQAIATVKHT